MWRIVVILSVVLLAGCPRDNPEDDYRMPPLPSYDPGGPSRPQNPQAPLPTYQQWGPVVPAGPQLPATDGGAAPSAAASATSKGPAK
jgi:hypothetical protein